MTSWRRYLGFRLAALVLGVLTITVILELVCRCLPVHEGLVGRPVNDENPVNRFASHLVVNVSFGPAMKRSHVVRTNDYGFVADVDYQTGGDRPVVAVIGDSFVEATYMAHAETLTGLLRRRLGVHCAFYSFATAGSSLAQYLAYADFARTRFAPRRCVVVVTANDFDESLYRYKRKPAFHYFRETIEGKLVLHRVDWSPSWRTMVVRRSRFLQYLVANLHVKRQIASLRRRFESVLSPVRTDVAVERSRSALEHDVRRQCRRAVDAFVAELPSRSGCVGRDILVVVDGERTTLYERAAGRRCDETDFMVDRRYLLARSRDAGFETLDLDDVFLTELTTDARRFEYEDDMHWNAHAHRVVRDAILASGFLDGLDTDVRD